MSPFSITVFRIRLLLLAVALGLTGFTGDKKASGIAEAGKPIKAVSASCNPTQQATQQLVAVRTVDCGAKKQISANS